MSAETGIQWTDATWNPVRGCSRVSEGCRHCYAERDAARKNDNPRVPGYHGFARFVTIGARPVPQWTGRVELIESRLAEPLRRRKPQRIFVNSMSDLFHESLPDEAIDRVFAVMAQSPQHTFQVLTKRPERMLHWFNRGEQGPQDYIDDPEGFSPDSEELSAEDHVDVAAGTFGWCHANLSARWPLPNVWLGVSVEDQKTADERIPLLMNTPAVVRFVSYEPALEAVDFARWLYPHIGYFNWLIVGGESGPGARPFDIAWARSAVKQCRDARVACFVKQLGARPVITEPLVEDPTYEWNPRVYPYRDDAGEIQGFGAQLVDKKAGDMDEWPEDLRVREFPEICTKEGDDQVKTVPFAERL